MLKKIVVAASAAAVVLGAGTAALASSGNTASPAPSASSVAPGGKAPGSAAIGKAARGNRHRLALRALRGTVHAQWVTRNGSTFVTHDAIRGVVTAVSAGSITVKAADGVSQSYAVTSATKVSVRDAAPSGSNRGNAQGRGRSGPAKAGKSSDVHAGDEVAVIGTGTASLTAGHILDRVQ